VEEDWEKELVKLEQENTTKNRDDAGWNNFRY
jgi:hypothetical protein